MSVFSGCSERSGYPVSGTVTYKGKPVPAGTVIFVPDQANRNRGVSIVAEIRNGSYSTDRGSGVFGGPYLVVVNGCDGRPVVVGEGGIDERGKPMFPQYEMRIELPTQEHILDIDVPVVDRTRSGPGTLGVGAGY